MAVIRFQCTDCNREIEIIEQPTGLEHIGPCNITNKCRGTLYKVARLEDYAVGRFPADVRGLTNYIQRNVVYNHTQAIADTVWLIEHNLGVNPSVQVVVDREEVVNGVVTTSRIEIQPDLITIIDRNTLTLTFDRPESGLAQVIARSTRADQEIETVQAAATYLPVTIPGEGVMTIGVNINSGQFVEGNEEGSCNVRIYYLDEEALGTAAFETAVFRDYDARSPVVTSPWNGTSEIFVNGETYTVLTIDIGDPVTELGAPTAGTIMFHAGNDTESYPYDQAPNMVVLLANAPYQNVDKVRERIFRPDLDLGPAQTEDSFIFANGEISVDQAVTERVFPPVYSVNNPQSKPEEPAPPAPVEGAFVLALGDSGSEGSFIGAIYTSDNDIDTWTGATIKPNGPVTNALGMVYGESIDTWVAVSNTTAGGNQGMQNFSTDDGASWRIAPRVDSYTGAANARYTSVTWSPTLERFVCGGSSSTQFQYSDDGITWVSGTAAGPNMPFKQIHSVHWSSGLGLFLAGTGDSFSEAARLAYSADGITWSDVQGPYASDIGDIDVVYSVGTRIFVGTDRGEIWYSDNTGTSWTESLYDVPTSIGDFGGIAANSDGSVIVAGGVGFNDGEYVWRSVDNGVNFTRIDVNSQLTGAPFNQYAYGLIYDPDYGFVQVGRNADANEQLIITSSDGITWTTRLQEKLLQPTGGPGSPNSVGSPQFALNRNELEVVASKNQV